MLRETLGAARDFGRLHDIASVLIRYGFGDLVRRMGLGNVLEKAGRILHWKRAEEIAHLELPQRVRHALQDLGPSFIKLGQILATRVDLFSPEWISEFERLQDQAPEVPFETLREQIEEDLGQPIDQIFRELDPEPIAAASIAQVHRAVLHNGREVVVKARRPDIRRTIDADMRLLARLAEVAEREIPEAKRYRPQEIVRQFTLSLRRELDLASECHYAERIAASFADDPHIIIPRVYWQWTSERMNVQQYIPGILGRDLEALEQAGLNRKVLAERGATAVLKMMLEDGFFHADPHPGNVLYLPGDRLAFIDFGMVARLSDARREEVTDLLYGLVGREPDKVVEVLMDWAGDPLIDTDRLASEVDAFLDRYHGLSLKQLNLAAMLRELVTLVRENELVLPSDLTLMFKALISLDGLGRMLDPDFDAVACATPFLRRIMIQRYAPHTLAQRGWRNTADVIRLMSALPDDMRRLFKVLRRGAFQLNVDINGLDNFTQHLDRAANRITVGLITAALIVGSSIVTTVREPGDTMLGVPLLGFIGYLVAAVGGIWVLLSIWRSRRD